MAKNDKITTDGGPTLFDALDPQEQGGTWQGLEPQEPAPKDNAEEPETAEVWADALRLLDALRDYADSSGAWFVNPPEPLIRRAELYYNQHVEAVRRVLRKSGADARTVHVVCRDYAGILSGTCEFTADALQMQTALRCVEPVEAFNIDRYGLYFGLLSNYSRFLLRFHDYAEAVKGEAATEESKRAFISGFYPAMDARAVTWLSFNGYLTASDFTGFDPSEMVAFFQRMGEYAQFADYTLYYVVARLALVATPAELDAVAPPPHLRNTQTPIAQFCEQVTRETLEHLNKAAEKFAEGLTANTPTKQEQARQAGKDWHDDTNARPVKIHENYGIVLSRPVNVSPHGQQVVTTLPVQQYIDKFKRENPTFGNITQMTVQKVFEGVNLLPQYLAGNMTRGEGGRLGFRTNISEFAEICGYADANQDEKRALLGGLHVLDGLYFVVDKPMKYTERTTAKGRKVKQLTGGRTAVRFLIVRSIGLDTGELFIEVYPESLQGRPTLITYDRFKKLRAQQKGLAQSRFNAQIETKSHKSENALIDEVFGYADMREHAAPEDLPQLNTYIRKNRPNARTKMLGWFQQYIQAGIIADFKREPSKTDKRDFVLSWSCPDTDKLRAFDDTDEPDEQ